MARKKDSPTMIGAGRGGPAVASTVKAPAVAAAPRSPKSSANRIANLGAFAHPPKKKKR